PRSAAIRAARCGNLERESDPGPPPSLLELQLARRALESGWLRERRVEFGAPGLDPDAPGGVLQEGSVEVRHDHRVSRLGRFDEDAAIRVEDHRVAGADLVVVDADPVAEDQEQAVVMRATRQPAHEPAAA